MLYPGCTAHSSLFLPVSRFRLHRCTRSNIPHRRKRRSYLNTPLQVFRLIPCETRVWSPTPVNGVAVVEVLRTLGSTVRFLRNVATVHFQLSECKGVTIALFVHCNGTFARPDESKRQRIDGRHGSHSCRRKGAGGRQVVVMIALPVSNLTFIRVDQGCFPGRVKVDCVDNLMQCARVSSFIHVRKHELEDVGVGQRGWYRQSIRFHDEEVSWRRSIHRAVGEIVQVHSETELATPEEGSTR